MIVFYQCLVQRMTSRVALNHLLGALRLAAVVKQDTALPAGQRRVTPYYVQISPPATIRSVSEVCLAEALQRLFLLARWGQLLLRVTSRSIIVSNSPSFPFAKCSKSSLMSTSREKGLRNHELPKVLWPLTMLHPFILQCPRALQFLSSKHVSSRLRSGRSAASSAWFVYHGSRTLVRENPLPGSSY